MGIVADYLRKKEIAKMNYPTIWYFDSNREGVSEIKEIHPVDVREGGIKRSSQYDKDACKWIGLPPVQTFKYKFDGSPYELSFDEGETCTCEYFYFSGCGDLWSGTKFAAFSIEELTEARTIELERITKKYNLK